MYKVEAALEASAFSRQGRQSFTGEAHTVRGLCACVANLVRTLHPRIETDVLTNGVDTIAGYVEKDAIAPGKPFRLSFGSVSVSIVKAG